MSKEISFWVALSVFPGIGPMRFKLLHEYFGSAKAVWSAPETTLLEIGLGDKLTRRFVDFRKTFEIDAYTKQLTRLHVGTIILEDPRYPKLLWQIPDAPFVLYVKGKRGDHAINLDRTIAVVGTRKMTPYGREVTEKIVEGLVAYGFTIVSGLAYGVDACAHETAIRAGGQTIAVLGCGIDIIAPPSNAGLYKKICECGRGAIVSEMPLGLRPTKGLFPARNRIISGMSLGVVVTEGADDSGALITARYASEQGREVFAVPGPITSRYSRGPAKLLKNGAKLVETVDDIVEELGTFANKRINEYSNKRILELNTNEEKKIAQCLSDRRMHINEIVRATGLTISAVAATLTLLEMRGIVRDYGEKVYGLNE